MVYFSSDYHDIIFNVKYQMYENISNINWGLKDLSIL